MVAGFLKVTTAAGVPVAARARLLVGTLDQALGLMFRLRMPAHALLFLLVPAREVTIHMWFVFFPIDVLWLDEQKRVVRTMTLRPWQVAPQVRAQYVLELPIGAIRQAGIVKGETLVFDSGTVA